MCFLCVVTMRLPLKTAPGSPRPPANRNHRADSSSIDLTRRKSRPSGQPKCLISKDVLISKTADLLIRSSNLVIKQK